MQTFSLYALVGVDEQSTRHTSTPKGRFVLRADSIRPYNCGGKAADGSTTSRPLQGVCKTVSEQQRTGRVREPTYRYKPGASLSGGTAAAGG